MRCSRARVLRYLSTGSWVVIRRVHVEEQPAIRIERRQFVGPQLADVEIGQRLDDAEISAVDPRLQVGRPRRREYDAQSG